MSHRTEPSRAFLVRDAHRKALTWHFVALSFGLVGLFALNRALTPEVFWAHWVALGWGVAFAVHLAYFARGTLESMGAWRQKKKQPRPSQPGEEAPSPLEGPDAEGIR